MAGADARERVLGTIWGSRDVRVPAADGAVGGGVGGRGVAWGVGVVMVADGCGGVGVVWCVVCGV